MIGIEFIRKLNEDTTVTLAEKLGVTNAIISQWENQKKSIPDKRLNQLSDLYNTDKSYFTKELTKLEQLEIEYKYLLDKKCDDSTKLYNLRSKIEIEEILKDVYEMLNNTENRKNTDFYDELGEEPKNKYARCATNAELIRKFIHILANDSPMLITYVLLAIEKTSNPDVLWSMENIFMKSPLVQQLIKSIDDWREYREKNKINDFSEFTYLFSLIDDD